MGEDTPSGHKTRVLCLQPGGETPPPSAHKTSVLCLQPGGRLTPQRTQNQGFVSAAGGESRPLPPQRTQNLILCLQPGGGTPPQRPQHLGFVSAGVLTQAPVHPHMRFSCFSTVPSACNQRCPGCQWCSCRIAISPADRRRACAAVDQWATMA